MRPGNRVYLGREGQREEYCEPVRNGGARPTTREKSATAARAELAVVTSAAFDRPRAWCCRASLAFVHCALFEPFCLSDVWTVWTHGASDLAVSGARVVLCASPARGARLLVRLAAVHRTPLGSMTAPLAADRSASILKPVCCWFLFFKKLMAKVSGHILVNKRHFTIIKKTKKSHHHQETTTNLPS